MDDMAGRLEALGFAEVFETGDKFIGKIPTRYTDYLAGRGLLDAYKRHIADRSYQGENEDGQNATKCVPMWDSTPTPLPLESYVDAWHGQQAVRWIERYDRPEPFFLFVGFPGPHDPWDAPAEAVARYRDVDISMPRSTRRPTIEGTGRYGGLLELVPVGLGLRVHDRRRHPGDAARRTPPTCRSSTRRSADMVGALERKGLLDNTWIIYTSDHGEMGGNHGLMSKCVLYEPAVRVPLIVRPPGGCPPRVVDALVEHVDVPATLREIAGAPEVPAQRGSLARSRASATRRRRRAGRWPSARTGASPPSRPSATSWWSTRTPRALPALRPVRGPRRGPRPAARPGSRRRRGGDHGDPPLVLPVHEMRLHIHPFEGSGDGLCGSYHRAKEPITVTPAEIIYQRRIAVLDHAVTSRAMWPRPAGSSASLGPATTSGRAWPTATGSRP